MNNPDYDFIATLDDDGHYNHDIQFTPDEPLEGWDWQAMD